MIELRVLRPDDWPVWRKLRLAALAEAPYVFGATLADWQGEGDREERWRGRLEIPGAHNVVAHLDGEPVGMVSGVPTAAPDAVELISLWVGPGARGRGLGDALVEEVLRWAGRDPGRKVLRLSVAPGNTAALALYERQGFEGLGRHSDGPSAEPDGELVMVRRLTSS
ncbi:GNAT family N-acetyltransferase [Streptomyces sp. LE64]|uniref:GNAT family N-acetyltransferase n=1 Tax=Streptomyces sp. LE64 TaxID=3448653 RepID=UPI0040413B55